MDIDFIISAVAFAIVGLGGLNLFLLFSTRDKISGLAKRIDAQTQRMTRLTEWLEGQKTGAKRKTKDGR